MKRKYEKDTEKIRREPPVVEFGGEVTLEQWFLTLLKVLNPAFIETFAVGKIKCVS